MKYSRMVTLFIVFSFVGCEVFENTELDETYFPLGLDYEWCYEYWNNCKCDTVTISVKNVDENSDKWTQYYLTEAFSDYFVDVGNPVQIKGDLVILVDGIDTISVIPDSIDLESFNFDFLQDTLHLYQYLSEGNFVYHIYTKRLKGIGVVTQGFSEWEWEGEKVSDRYYRLLYFQKGDTVWRQE